MKTKLRARIQSPLLLAMCACGMLCSIFSAQAQPITTVVPTGWIADPYSGINANFGTINPNTSFPTFTNNGAGLGNFWAFSPLGQTLTLSAPGQSVIMTAQVSLLGNANNANLQFRFGIPYAGANPPGKDTGWNGVLIAEPNTGGQNSLYAQKIPNSSQFSTSGSSSEFGGSTSTYSGTLGPATFNYTLGVTYLSSSSELVTWSIQGVPPSTYLFYGRYTNTSPSTLIGFNFDTIGFLCGGSTWTSTSTTDGVAVTNDQVVFGNFGDGTWAGDNSGTWSTVGNWLNNVPANGAGYIANFSQVTLTADRTVTLDTSRSVGSMIFGATGGSLNNWIITNSGGSTLTLNNNTGTNPPPVAVNQNTASLNLPLISTNGLTKTGAGILALGGTNSITGALNLDGGELGFSSLSNLPLSASTIPNINFAGGALLWEPGNTVDISAQGITIPFSTSNVVFDTGANNVTLSTSFGDLGPQGLQKLGTGTLTVNGDIQYLGQTLIKNGALTLTSTGYLGGSSGFVILPGATFDVTAQSGGLSLLQSLYGAGSVNGSLVDTGEVIGAGYAATGAAGTLAISGNLTLNGGGAVNFGLANATTAGSGVNDLITVAGNLNISGVTPINVVLINGSPALGTYTLFSYGTFSGSASNLTPPPGFVVTNNTVAKTIGLTVTHIPANLIWEGDGIFNDWDTDTSPNWLQSGSPQFFFAGDSVTFNDNGHGGTAAPITITNANVAPGSTLVSNNSVVYDFSGGQITSGTLIKTGTGTLILENSNTYNGPTVISNGEIQVGGVNTGGGSGSLGTGPITNNGQLVFDLAQNYTLAGNMFGAGNITNIGFGGTIFLTGNVTAANIIQSSATASLELTGSNNVTGQILVTNGTLLANSALALNGSTNAVVISSGGQLYINANVNITNKTLWLAGTGPSSTGALRKGGNGATTFNGVIRLTNNAQIEVDGGSTFNLTSATPIASTNLTNVNLTLDAASGGAGNITSQLALGSGTLTVQDAGNWYIAPSNNYTGLTVINGGMLVVAGPNALGPITNFTANYVTLGGGTLGVTNNVTFSDGLRGFTASGTAGGFDVTNGATLTIANQISGAGTLVKSDSGTLILSGSNSFSGTLDVDSGGNASQDGIVEITTGAAVTNVLSPIALRDALGSTSTFALNGSGGNINVAQSFTISSRSSAAVPAIDSLAGTNAMTGNFTATGGGGSSHYIVECDGGLLTLGTSGTVLTSTTTDPQSFTFQGIGPITVAGALTDSTNAGATLGVVMNGTGDLTLAAVNTNTGPTTVNSGILTVTGATGIGAVNVTGGTLGGTGTVGGAVTTSAGSFLSPSAGGTPVSTLTLLSNLSIGGNVVIDINKTLVQTNDKVTVNGTLANVGSGTLTVSNLGPALSPGDKFQIFNKLVTGGGTINVTGSGAVWANNLAGDGTIQVVSVGRPAFTTPTLQNGTNLVLHATNGTPSGPYSVLSSTNVSAPLSTWLVIKSGNFDGSGTLTVTNIVSNGVPKQFFILQQP